MDKPIILMVSLRVLFHMPCFIFNAYFTVLNV